MTKYTFTMIKPDAVQRGIIGNIISKLETIGEIIDIRIEKLSQATAKEFYKEHAERSFFSEMINDITSTPVVLICLKGDDDIINTSRKLIGDTNPKNAKLGTIRKSFALNIGQNSIHGSDSNTSADRELNIFFPNLKK